jgi:hypothetical protein
MTEKETMSPSVESIESPTDPSTSPLALTDDKKPFSRSLSTSSISSDSDGSESIHEVDPEKQLSRHVSKGFGGDLERTQTGISVATNATTDPAFEIDWEEDDSGNPQNWPAWRKALVIFCTSISTITV